MAVPAPTTHQRCVFHGATRQHNSPDGNPVWLLHTSLGDFYTEPDSALGNEVANHLDGSADFYVNLEVVLTLKGITRRRVIEMAIAETAFWNED